MDTFAARTGVVSEAYFAALLDGAALAYRCIVEMQISRLVRIGTYRVRHLNVLAWAGVRVIGNIGDRAITYGLHHFPVPKIEIDGTIPMVRAAVRPRSTDGTM